jgi:hypothetical protein
MNEEDSDSLYASLNLYRGSFVSSRTIQRASMHSAGKKLHKKYFLVAAFWVGQISFRLNDYRFQLGRSLA